MNTLQKTGGLAAIYLAAAHVVGMALFLLALDYPNIVDPVQKVDLIAGNATLMYSTNLLMYVGFGAVLVVFVVALRNRLDSGSSALTQMASVFGFIWAGSLIGSGMVSNAGIAQVVALHGRDPSRAAESWQGTEVVANGLGNANGEILGGLMALLFSLAALRSGGLPRPLGYLGLCVGLAGIVSTIPVFNGWVAAFGVSQIIWFVWIAVILVRGASSAISLDAT